MLSQCLALANGKGGVGKTTLACNLAGFAAQAGWKLLLVDTDPAGGVGVDVGVTEHDEGAGLVAAIAEGAALEPVRDVRAGLDVVFGGSHLKRLPDLMTDRFSRGSPVEASLLLDRALAPLAAGYDLVILDTPPGDLKIQILAVNTAHWLVIPTRADQGSIRSLADVVDLVTRVRGDGTNPGIEILGVALTFVEAAASRVRSEARAALTDMLGEVWPLFDTTIRHSQTAAHDMRRDGVLAGEYFAAGGRRRASAAPPLAADFAALCQEILTAVTARLAGEGQG